MFSENLEKAFKDNNVVEQRIAQSNRYIQTSSELSVRLSQWQYNELPVYLEAERHGTGAKQLSDKETQRSYQFQNVAFGTDQVDEHQLLDEFIYCDNVQ